MCVKEQSLRGGRTPWSKWMRSKPPTTNIYFIVKPCAWTQKPWITMGWFVRRGGRGGCNTILVLSCYPFTLYCVGSSCMCLCSSIISINTKKMRTTTPPTNNICLFGYGYSIIFVFLRLCNSHQLLCTLTKYVRSKVKTTTTTTKWVGVFVGGEGWGVTVLVTRIIILI